MPQVDWKVPSWNPIAGPPPPPNFGGQRALAMLLQLAIWQQHLTGSDAAALETVLDGLSLGDRLCAVQYWALVGVLVATATDALLLQPSNRSRASCPSPTARRRVAQRPPHSPRRALRLFN